MLYYRLYHLNRSSGHIDSAEDFNAANDAAAVVEAAERQRGAAVELWQSDRKVHRIEGRPDLRTSATA